MDLIIKSHLVEFPVGENIPCRISGISRDPNWQNKWDILDLGIQTEVPENRDGKTSPTRWVGLRNKFFIPKDENYKSFLKQMYSLGISLGIDVDDFPYAEQINEAKGVIDKELAEKFISAFMDKIRNEIISSKKRNSFYIKTRINQWKDFAMTNIGLAPYLSIHPDLEYHSGEDVLNTHILIQPKNDEK